MCAVIWLCKKKLIVILYLFQLSFLRKETEYTNKSAKHINVNLVFKDIWILLLGSVCVDGTCIRDKIMSYYKTFPQTCSLSEAVHLAVIDPAVDGEVVGVSLRGFHFHLFRKPIVFKEQEARFVQLDLDQLSNGDRARHCKTRHLE